MNWFILNNKAIVGSILNWINERKTSANILVIKDAIGILSFIASKASKGKILLNKYGSKDFFLAFRSQANEEIVQDVETLIKLLVNEENIEEDKENNSMMSNINDQYSESGIATEDEYRFINTKNIQNFEGSINYRDFTTQFGAGLAKNSQNSISFGNQTKKFDKSSNFEEMKEPKEEKERKFNAFEWLQNKKSSQRSYIELEKEKWELPYVALVESDENYIMDWGVRIKFGDNRKILEASRELEVHLLKDFPLEVFLQRTDILNAALEMMVETIDLGSFHSCIYLLTKFVENSVNLYRFLLNPYNRFWEISRVETEVKEEHILKMYPANSESKWKEVKFNPDSLSSTNFDSHSLWYTLCEIVGKCLDWCLHEEKVGAALTVSTLIIYLHSFIVT